MNKRPTQNIDHRPRSVIEKARDRIAADRKIPDSDVAGPDDRDDAADPAKSDIYGAHPRDD